MAATKGWTLAKSRCSIPRSQGKTSGSGSMIERFNAIEAIIDKRTDAAVTAGKFEDVGGWLAISGEVKWKWDGWGSRKPTPLDFDS